MRSYFRAGKIIGVKAILILTYKMLDGGEDNLYVVHHKMSQTKLLVERIKVFFSLFVLHASLIYSSFLLVFSVQVYRCFGSR